jgi:competence protein ComFC
MCVNNRFTSSFIFLCEHLYLKKIFKKYCVCTLCSSDAKRMERGFEPAIDMYSSLDVFVHSPFYKKKDIKQSSATKLQRSQIKNVLGLKQLYPLPKKKYCWWMMFVQLEVHYWLQSS